MTTVVLGSEAFDITFTNTATVPSGCNAIVALWSLDMTSNGSTMTTMGIGGSWTTTMRTQVATVGATFERNAGSATLLGGGTGSHTVSITGSSSTSQGPNVYLVYLTVDDTGDFYRDSIADNKDSATAPSGSLTTNASDSVFMIDARYAGGSNYPSTPSGWTSLQTVGLNNQFSRLSQCDSPGASSTTCTGQDPNWSAIAAIAIKAGGASSSTSLSGKLQRSILLNGLVR